MSDAPKNADNDNKQPETVVQRVLGAFYNKLAEKEEYKDLADRLKNEKNHTEASIRIALFGEESK